MSDPIPAALKRAEPPARIIVERPETVAGSGDPAIPSAYSRALDPTWFADRERAWLFTPPCTSSVTGAAVVARLRREGYDWRPLFRGLLPPTLVIHGEADLLPISVAEGTAGRIEGARLQTFPDVRHMRFRGAPERFHAAVDAFVSDDDPEKRP